MALITSGAHQHLGAVLRESGSPATANCRRQQQQQQQQQQPFLLPPLLLLLLSPPQRASTVAAVGVWGLPAWLPAAPAASAAAMWFITFGPCVPCQNVGTRARYRSEYQRSFYYKQVRPQSAHRCPNAALLLCFSRLLAPRQEAHAQDPCERPLLILLLRCRVAATRGPLTAAVAFSIGIAAVSPGRCPPPQAFSAF